MGYKRYIQGAGTERNRKVEMDLFTIFLSCDNISRNYLKIRNWLKRGKHAFNLTGEEMAVLSAERAILISGYDTLIAPEMVVLFTGHGYEKMKNILDKAEAKMYVVEYMSLGLQYEFKEAIYVNMLQRLKEFLFNGEHNL